MSFESANERFTQNAIIVTVILAVCYNAILALVNAHVAGLSFKVAAGTELLILCSAIVLILRTGLTENDNTEIGLVLMVFALAIFISIMNQQLFVDSIRNFLIIVLFVMLGRRIKEAQLHKVFWLISLVVFAFLTLEVVALDWFAKLLNPAGYYAATRGVQVSEFNTTGLFNTAQGFSGRFGYGIFDGPRTSSIFLEQVSLSNFAIILVTYLAVFWDRLSRNKKLFFVALVVFVLITARSRSALVITMFALATYHILPLIPRRMGLLIFPAILTVVFTVYLLYPTSGMEDTFKGRISHTGFILAHFDIGDYFSNSIFKLSSYADSGIPYMITSYTLVGALVLWLYFVLVVAEDGPRHRRFVILSNLYLFTLLMVGSAVFTIKTASVLWLLAGFLSVTSRDALENGIGGEQ